MNGPESQTRRPRTQRAARTWKQRRPPEPVITTNLLGDLPTSLRRLATRVGDVRKIRRIGPAAIELNIEDARALGLVQ